MPEHQNRSKQLTPEQAEKAKLMKVWVVWYEDRFAWGPDREPASPVTAFLTEGEAEEYASPHDIEAGKFDGEFIQEWNLLRAVERGVVEVLRAKELIQQDFDRGESK